MAVEKEYILDGNIYTASDLELLAQDEGVLVDDIIEGYGFEEKPIKTTAGDEYSDPKNTEKYTEFKPDRNFITVNGQQVFEDEYNVNFAGKPIANSSRKYPNTFEDYAKSFKADIQVLKGSETIVPKDGLMLDEVVVESDDIGKLSGELKDDDKTKSYSPSQEADNFINAQNAITKESPDAINRIADKYFDLSNFEGPKTKTVFGDDPSEDKVVETETEEEALKRYFYSEEYGDKKYKEYIKYRDSKRDRSMSKEANAIHKGGWGDLDFDSELLQNSGAIEAGLNDAKDLYANKYFNKLGKDKQEQIARYLPDIFGNRTNKVEYEKRKKDEVDFENKFGRPLLKTETIQGRTYVPNHQAGRPTGYLDQLKPQEKYLKEMRDNLTRDYDDLQARYSKYEGDVLPYQTKMQGYEKELNDLGPVDAGSDPEKIKKYNDIVGRLNKTRDEILTKGFDKILKGILSDQKLADTKRDSFLKMAERYNDLSIATNAARLNYDNFDRAALNIEKALFGGGAMLGAFALQGLGYITEGVQSVVEQSDEDMQNAERLKKGEEAIEVEYENDFLEATKLLTQQAVNYNQRLDQNLQNNYARKFKMGDGVDFGTYISQTLADQSPSIISVLGPMGGGAILSRAALSQLSKKVAAGAVGKLTKQQIMKNAGRLTMGAMFVQSGGGSLANYEMAAMNAPKIIAMNKKLLEQAKTEDEKLQYQKNIANAEAALDATFMQKAASGILHGTIEMYAEKLGTLRYLQNAKFVRATSNLKNPVFRFGQRALLNTWGIGKQIGKGIGVEQLEENLTQIGQNATDIIVMGEDKSIIDGIDADFFASTAITSLALQSGNVISNMYNAIANETQSAYEILQNRGLLNELIITESKLQDPSTTFKQREKLRSRKKAILRKAGLNSVMSMQKLNSLTLNEKKTLFEAARLRRKTIKEIYEARINGADQAEIDGLLDKFNQHEKQRNDLASKARIKQNESQINKLRKAAGMDAVNDGQRADIMALNKLYTDVAELGQLRNGKDFKVFDLDGKNFKDLSQKEKTQLIKDYASKYGNKAMKQVIDAYNDGDSAVNVDGNIIVFQDNINTAIALGNYTDAKIAAVSPMHELLHTELKKLGLVKDGKISAYAVQGVRGLFNMVEQKFKDGKITKEQYDTFKKREAAYRKNNKGIMDYEEMITLVNDMIAIGAISEASFSKLYDFKAMMNKLVGKYQKGAGIFYEFDTGSDIYRFITRFQQKAKAGDIKGGKEEPKSDRTVKSSVNVNDLYEQEGIAAYQDILDAKKPYAISLANKYRNRPKFSEYKDILVDEILTGKRGMLELIIGYDDYVQRQAKEGKDIAPLDAYINNALSPRGLNRVQEIADRILGKDEQSQFTTSLDAETTFTQVQDYSDVTGSIPQKVEQETGTLRKLLNIETDGTLYNKVLKDVENTLQKDLPNIEKDPKKFRQALEKAYVKAFEKEIGKIIGTQKSAKFKDFITKNKKIIQDLLAHKYKKRFPFMTNSLGRMTAEESRKSQTALGGSFVTDDYAGNQKYELNNLSDQDMLDNFVAGRETQYKSLKRALAAELGLDATFDALLRDDRDHNKLKGFTGKMSESLKRDPSVKFSLNLNKLSPLAISDFHTNKEQFFKELAGSTSFDATGVRKAFNKVFNKDEHPELYAGRDGIIKDFTRYMKPFTKIDPKGKSKLKKSEIKDVFERSMQDIDQEQDLKYIFGLEKGIGKMYDDAKELDKYHKFNKKMVEDMVEQFGEEKAMTMLISFHMASIKNSGKTGSGVYTYNSEQDTFVLNESERSNRQGYNLYGTNKELYDALGLANYGVTLQGKRNEFYLNGKKLKQSIQPQSTSGIQQAMDNKLDMAARKKEVKEIRNFLKWQMQWATDLVNDKKSIFDKNQFAMMMQGLSSNMNTAMRAAALLKYTPKDFSYSNDASQYEYEHMTPARVMSLYLLEHYYNGNKNINPDKIFDEYYAAIVPKNMDTSINTFYKKKMPEGWRPGDNIFKRYYNSFTLGKEMYAMKDIETGKVFGQYHENIWKGIQNKELADPKDLQTVENIIVASSININAPRKGISVFDFDDTLARSNSKVGVTMPDGTKMKINATEFAEQSADLEAAGAEFDFSEFSKVIEGKKGPLFDLAIKRQGKFGSGDIFVLTARPQEAAYAIHAFLKGVGLNIPIDNIVGLEDGKASAKADWMIGKVTEGYNDFYFADDAIKNVKAVKQVLDQFDVKSDVQQAIVKSSINLDTMFNKIIEENKGVKADAKYSTIVAKRMGAKKGKYQFYLPPSAEDFKGLIYSMLGKGRKGDAQFKFFKQHLIDPYTRGISAMNLAKTEIKSIWTQLLKAHPSVKKKLGKLIPGTVFTYDHAARVFIWNKNGVKIPGLSKRDTNQLVKAIEKDQDMLQFINDLESTRPLQKSGYPQPDDYWDAGSILSELNGTADIAGRKVFIKQWIDNKNQIFNKDNLNKIEAQYGTNFREALEDILWRMENGTNRNFGQNKLVNEFNDWINNAVGAVMFINIRSAMLQTLSTFNFVNWGDNNPMKAALAFANQPQYWKDWVMIWNSPKLLARRRGLQLNVQEQELANAATKGGPKAVLSYLLKIGFTPTQMADSFAIATGGAMFYRNRVNTYKKQGLDQKAAEEQAFKDFSDIAEETQQSGDPMLISPIQAGALGRPLFSWQNTPFQYNRLMKRAAQDIINRRRYPGMSQFQSDTTNISKILYYGMIQNFVFTALQSALFAMLPGFTGDEDEDEDKQAYKEAQKVDRIINNMVDTILRGSGLPGAIVSTIKNVIREYSKQEEKGFLSDHTYTIIQAINLSPPIGSKVRKVYSAIQTKRFERDVIEERGFAPNSPIWQVIGGVVSAAANIPLDNAVNILDRTIESLDERNQAWQRVAMALGWNTWDVGAKDEEGEEIKAKAKEIRKKEGIEKAKKTRAENKRKKQEAQLEEINKKLEEARKKFAEDKIKISN